MYSGIYKKFWEIKIQKNEYQSIKSINKLISIIWKYKIQNKKYKINSKISIN